MLIYFYKNTTLYTLYKRHNNTRSTLIDLQTHIGTSLSLFVHLTFLKKT